MQLTKLESSFIDREEQLQSITNYYNHIDEYCINNGISLFQYEKQCFMADRGYGDYPDPERYNLEREIGSNKSEPSKDYGHEL